MEPYNNLHKQKEKIQHGMKERDHTLDLDQISMIQWDSQVSLVLLLLLWRSSTTQMAHQHVIMRGFSLNFFKRIK